MTYGFGFWRSGYTTLIPWHWAWTPRPDQFDYLRGRRSGCGQRIDDDGEVIPAVYWECFREGRDDARYVYTLQQAVWEREGTADPDCRRLVARGRAVLQELWDAIEVQQKYLADDLWTSEEFNARRWRLAQAIEALRAYPPVRSGPAPSVLVADTQSQPPTAETPMIEQAMDEGNVQALNLGAGYDAWRNGTGEGAAEITEAASPTDQPGLRWRVVIDHKTDGGEGGQYPIGWPRIARTFPPGALDLSGYDYLRLLVRVDSDRDEVADDSTPLGLTISSHQKARQFFETKRDLGGGQRVWVPLLYSVPDMIRTAGMGPDPWKTISRVQLFLSESDYPHDVTLTFDVAEVKLLRFKSPVVSQLHAPRFVLLPDNHLPVGFEVIGLGSVRQGSHHVTATVRDRRGRLRARGTQDLTAGQVLVLDVSQLVPGPYRLHLEVTGAQGKRCSESSCAFEALAGPQIVAHASR